MNVDFKRYYKLLLIKIYNSYIFFLKPIKLFDYFLNNLVFYRLSKFLLLNKNNLIIKNLNGINFVINPKDYVNSRKVYVNNYFPQFSEAVSAIEYLKKARNNKVKIFVDIGAHYGNLSIPLMKKYEFNECYAIEPMLENYNILKQNILLNSFEKKIIPINRFISDNKETFEINTFSNNSAASMNLNDLNAEDINTYQKINNLKIDKKELITSTTLDKAIASELGQDSLIWIYAQGSEVNILKGADTKFKKTPPLVIAYSPNINNDFKTGPDSQIFRLIKDLNYEYVINLSESELIEYKINNHYFINLSKKLKNNSGTSFLMFL